MHRKISVAALALTILPTPAAAWGKTGHRIVGAIGDHYLSARARAGVKSILSVETMAEASNWPDLMKSDPLPFWQREASVWHYVTVPEGKTYADVGAPPEGDAVTALKRFSATVRDRKASLADRQLALRFIIHLVGDLHQPLHVGDGTDRGGNDKRVTFFGKSTNLHSVWDSGLIDDQQLSYSEYTAWLLPRITPDDLKAWSNPDPQVWIAESAAVRPLVYPAGEGGLSYRYVYDQKARLEGQLERGGVRLAAYLNDLFASRPRRAVHSQPTPSPARSR